MPFLSFWPYLETFKATVCYIIASPQIASTYYLGNEDTDVAWPYTIVTLYCTVMGDIWIPTQILQI